MGEGGRGYRRESWRGTHLVEKPDAENDEGHFVQLRPLVVGPHVDERLEADARKDALEGGRHLALAGARVADEVARAELQHEVVDAPVKNGQRFKV